MVRVCIFCGLDNSCKQKHPIHFYQIPKDDNERRTWIEASGKNIPPRGFVCSKHFPAEDIGLKKRMGALPTKISAALISNPTISSSTQCIDVIETEEMFQNTSSITFIPSTGNPSSSTYSGPSQAPVVFEYVDATSLENNTKVSAGASSETKTSGVKRTLSSQVNAAKGKRSNTSKQNKDCKNHLRKNNDVIDEYDAVAISWAKKIKRMDSTQAIYAETLVNKIISQGLLNQLTRATDVTDQQMSQPSLFSPDSQCNVMSSNSSSVQDPAPLSLTPSYSTNLYEDTSNDTFDQ